MKHTDNWQQYCNQIDDEFTIKTWEPKTEYLLIRPYQSMLGQEYEVVERIHWTEGDYGITFTNGNMYDWEFDMEIIAYTQVVQ